ncbi:phage holin family protein [Oceanobacillus sp. J11TS1]|uniref:phage holin family protein n=1 Tax=Oceanobacillus sp. J11TS1 TaxID=2807191 RepID=UPI001B1C2E15|nr:phage holin family protein [Oceanobacillus sp. J11TS1]GIO25151.1 hypothetical protein J11TS1_37320 [Oceanobacillus sp. J11TS1]
MEMISFFQSFLETRDSFATFLLTLILIASTIDFLFGWINARFNKNVVFKSGIALFGIIKKIMYFIVLVFFIPASVLVPESVGIPALFALYIGYLISEINSILSHLELTEDGKKGELFREFMSRLLKSEKKE